MDNSSRIKNRELPETPDLSLDSRERPKVSYKDVSIFWYKDTIANCRRDGQRSTGEYTIDAIIIMTDLYGVLDKVIRYALPNPLSFSVGNLGQRVERERERERERECVGGGGSK